MHSFPRPLTAGPLHSLSVCSLFGAISANGHTAPASGTRSGPIEEEKRTGLTLARFYTREILRADQLRHRLGDWNKQGLRRTPASLDLPFEVRRFTVFVIARHDLTEFFVAREDLIERLKPFHRFRRKGLSPILIYESAGECPAFPLRALSSERYEARARECEVRPCWRLRSGLSQWRKSQ